MHIRRWIVVITLCAIVTATLAAYKILQIRKAIAFAKSFPEHSETVNAVIAKQVLWAPTVKTMGEVNAVQSIDLRNELEGKIVEVGFTPGASVSKNQILVQLDISQELAQLNAADAEAKLARLELDRNQRLITQKLSSKEQFDRAKAQMAIADAGVQALRASIAKKTLKAPFDAYAGLHNLEAGQYLASNTLITQLVGINSSVWIDFFLPQEQATLATNTHVTISAPNLLTEPTTGTIIARDSSVTAQSRNLRFRAVLNGVSEQLKPGVIVEVTIPSAQTTAVTVLPITAVRHDHFGANVYVLLADQDPSSQKPTHIRAYKRVVTLGPVYKDQIIITSGVQPGERIAANGSYKLRDAMLVNLHETGKTKATATASGIDHE